MVKYNDFEKVIKEDEEDEENEKMTDNNNIMSEKNNIIKIGNNSSIKISSSLNNKKKPYFNNKQNNNRNIISNIIYDKDNKIDEDFYANSNLYISKTSIFNNENEYELSNTINLLYTYFELKYLLNILDLTIRQD